MAKEKVLLKTENIKKSFGNLVAVDEVSFEIEEGEIVGLIGPNGAGKTTLFNLISGIYKPDSGTVEYKGEDITGNPPHEICRRGIAKTYQTPRNFTELTVLENLNIGTLFGGEGKEEITPQEILELVGLRGDEDRLAKELIFTERKKLDLGRALSTSPTIILVDEIVAGLHPSDVDDMVDTLKKIRKDLEITIFWVEHVMRAIMGVSDRVVVLTHGEKIAEGTPENVSQDEKVVEAYLGE